MIPFTNKVILIASLPKYEEAEMTSVQKKYWNVMVINFLIEFLIVGGIITIVAILTGTPQFIWYILIAYCIIMIITFFLRKISFSRRSYALREKDIIYRHGILSTKTTIIPFTRVQHVGINEGFVSRLYNLAQLQIFTAGGLAGHLKISGLSKEDAEKLKEAVMLHIKEKDEYLKKEIEEV